MATPEGPTLVALIQKRAEAFPDRGYFFLGDGVEVSDTMLYPDLDRRARSIAVQLLETHTAGTRVLLLFEPGLDFVAAFFGCLYAGMMAVPVVAPHPARFERQLRRMRAITVDSGLEIVLTSETLHQMGQAMFPMAPEMAEKRWVAVDDDAPHADTWVEPDIDGKTLALLQYTSGSTGQPRGVVVTHESLINTIAACNTAIADTEHSVFVSWLPVYHDMGLIGKVLFAAAVGADIYMMSPIEFLQDPRKWLQAVTRYGGTLAGGPNFGLELCLRKISDEDLVALDLSTLEVLYCGSEPVRPDTIRRFIERFARAGLDPTAMLPVYGLAECTLGVTISSPTGVRIRGFEREAFLEGRLVLSDAPDAYEIVSCGEARTDERIVIAGPDGERLPPDRIGEIWVSGTSVANGYWNKPDVDAEVFHAHLTDGEGPFLRTGDLGFLDEDGHLYIAGRVKDLIIVRGRNLYPHDIELSVERSSPCVKRGGVAAFAVDGVDGEGVVVVAEIDVRRHPDADLDAVVQAARAVLAEEHEVALQRIGLIRSGTLPKTPSGKVQRRLTNRWLHTEKLDLLLDWQAPVAPSTDAVPTMDLDATDAEAVTDFLIGWLVQRLRQEVSRDASFAELGVDSMQLVELTDALREALGRPGLPASIGRDYPSIPELAAYLADLDHSERKRVLDTAIRIQPTDLPGGTRLSSFQRVVLAWERRHDRTSTWTHSVRYGIAGAVDLEALNDAVRGFTERQEAVRQRITLDGGPEGLLPVDAFSVELAFYDDQSAANDAYEELVASAFPIDGSPLIRFILQRASGSDDTLILLWHQLLQEGTGGMRMMRELLELFAAKLESRAPDLPDLPVRWIDYIAWEDHYFSGPGRPLVQRARDRLEGAVPLFRDADAPLLPENESTTRSILFSTAQSMAFHRFAERTGATFFVAVAALVGRALGEFAGKQDVLFASPTRARNRSEIMNLVGRFGAWTPFRLRLVPEGDNRALVEQIRSQSSLALDPVPGPALFGQDDVFAHPAMRVIINTPDIDLNTVDVFDGAGFTATSQSVSKPVVGRVDLSILAAEMDGDVVMRIGANAALFDTDALERFATILQDIVTRLDDAPPVAAAAPAPSRRRADPSRGALIALEETFATPAYLAALERRVVQGPQDELDVDTARFFVSNHSHAGGVREKLLDLGPGRLRAMDEAGIERAVLSLMSPGVQMFEEQEAIALARETNDALANAIQLHPGRFSGFATIAPQNPQEAAREIRRAATELGLCGVLVNSHTHGRYLDEPQFAPILEAAEAHGMPLYIHPRNPPAAERDRYVFDHMPRMTEVMWGFQAETAYHAARLIVSGVLERYPKLQIVLGHLGEGLPMLIWRMNWAARITYDLPRTPWQVFQNHFHLTTSGIYPSVTAWKALRFCIDLLGPERILFAADHPFADMREASHSFADAELTDEEREMIARSNAERLLGPFPAPRPSTEDAASIENLLPDPMKVMRMISGGLVSQAIYVVCELGVADVLSDGPASVAAIAKRVGAHEDNLFRILRLLAGFGIFQQRSDGRFMNTLDSELLRRDSSMPLRSFSLMFGDESARAIVDMLHTVKTGETAFEHVHGMSHFDYLSQHPEKEAIFADAMRGLHGRETQPMLEAYDFGQFEHIIDIGGSHGDVMLQILGAFPEPNGTVFDLPTVVAEAKRNIETAGLADRCAVVGGSFMEGIPPGADCYFMRHIVHDWSEAVVIDLLTRCREGLAPGGRVVVVETLVPEDNVAHPSKLFDLSMMALPGGRERSRSEYEALFAKAGLRIRRVVETGTPASVIELVPGLPDSVAPHVDEAQGDAPQPPKTKRVAVMNALHRAVEMRLEPEDRVCTDPMAKGFLPSALAEILSDSRELEYVRGMKEAEFPGMNGAFVARTRFIDDLLELAVQDGLEQLVLVGAGLDSRAYRFTAADLHVFEVDDPSTQQMKMARVQQSLGRLPDHVTYVSTQLFADQIGDALLAHGFVPEHKTLFVIEGLMMFFPEDAARELFAFIARSGGEVVFDCVQPDVVSGTSGRTEARNLRRQAIQGGEQLELGFTRSQLLRFLDEVGFDVERCVHAVDLHSEYFRGPNATREVSPIFTFAHARARAGDVAV